MQMLAVSTTIVLSVLGVVASQSPSGLANAANAYGFCYSQDDCIGDQILNELMDPSECFTIFDGQSWRQHEENKRDGRSSRPPCLHSPDNVLQYAQVYGDPHFSTWTGERFDYHGQCDLVFVHSDQFGQGLGLDIHIRTQIEQQQQQQQQESYSFVASVAVRIGKDILQVDGSSGDGSYYINGNHFLFDPSVQDNLAGYKLIHRMVVATRNTGNDASTIFLHRIKVGGPDGKEEILIKSSTNQYMAVKINSPSVQNFAQSYGLLGSYGDAGVVEAAHDDDDVVVVSSCQYDGAAAAASMLERHVNVTDKIRANAYGQSWQVRQPDDPRLFRTARYPQFPQKCILPQQRQRQQQQATSSVHSHCNNKKEKDLIPHWQTTLSITSSPRTTT